MIKNKTLVSVIVPIYKVEEYLNKCLDSILAQTYTNLEVILVDDGSPDGCPKICDEYAKKDSRIKVIHKENGGLSDARNAGLAIAKGEYISFVDSDDWLPENSIETLLNIAEEFKVPMVIGGNKRVFDNSDIQIDNNGHNVEILTPVDAMRDFFVNGCAAWATLYKKEIHQDILFPVGEINEDEAIVLQLRNRCNAIAKTDQVVYFYNCRPESITTAAFSTKKLDLVKHCKDNLEWVMENHPELENDALTRLVSNILWAMREMALASTDFSDEVKKLKICIKQNYKMLRNSDIDNAKKIRLFCGRYVPFWLYRFLERLISKK